VGRAFDRLLSADTRRLSRSSFAAEKHPNSFWLFAGPRLMFLQTHGSCVTRKRRFDSFITGDQRMPQLQARRFRATIQMADGRRIEIDELLTAEQHTADAKRLGAVKVELDNGTEIFLNTKREPHG
jgi:hypothetical protein